MLTSEETDAATLALLASADADTDAEAPALRVKDAATLDDTDADTTDVAADSSVTAAVVHAPSSIQTPAAPPGVSASVHH